LAWIAWAGALAVAVLLLAVGGFVSRDPDSRVYSEISAHLANRPLASWIAPEWFGVADAEGPFREHPFGIFVLPALLARTGYPALQAGYAIGTVFSVLAVILLGRVASLLIPSAETVAVQWAVLLLPVAFVYRIRANQEYPVLVLLLAAVYATERVRRSPAWTIVPPLATLAILIIKDVFFVFAPIACALWLLAVPGRGTHERRAWICVALSVVGAVIGAVAYDAWYRHATGESFIPFFVQFRLTPNSGLDRSVGVGAAIFQRVSNLGWYVARLVWFSFPASVALFFGMRRRGDRPAAADDGPRLSGAVVFSVALAAVAVALMSLGNNRADRFIFPAYFAVGAAGAALAIRRWQAPARWARRVGALGSPGTALLWLVLFVLTLASSGQLLRVKLWP
jgi:hypothetical protein